MAILMRGGLYADFDPSKLRPREWAVVMGNDPGAKDGRTVYLCFSSGVTKRIATHEDMTDIILNATEDIREEFEGMFDEILAQMRQLKSDTEVYKNISVAKAGEASSSAAAAQASAKEAADAVKGISGSVQTATQKATEAAQSASSAAGAMSSANASAESALASKQAAEAAKNAASTSETAAGVSEISAAGSATAAAASATDAAESAASALDSKEAAAGSAEDAAGSAETAKQYSGNPPKPQNGTWWIWDATDGEYKDSGTKSVLSIVKSYPSVAAMEADKTNMQEGDLVIIASDTWDVDNSKLYVHNGTDWVYLSDLSGLQGVGIASIIKTSGTGLSGSTDVYTITLTDGSTSTFTVYNGLDGTGTGDMAKSVYDTKGKNQDVFDYVDDGLARKADLQDGKIPEGQIPDLGYIPDSQKGDAGGVATLGTDGKVPAEQLPYLDYIPVTEKGTANGVATLDASGKVLGAQLPPMDYEPTGSVSAHNVSPSAHSDIRTLIDGKGDTLEYDVDESKLYLKSGDTVLSTVEIEGGGGGGIKLAAPTDISLTNQDEAVLIKWTDPADIVLNGVAIATWAGTLVVRKVGSAPTSKTDGILVVDSKTRDAYKETGFVDTGLTNGTQYFYGIFPYTTDKAYTYDATDSITPEAIYPDAPTGVTVQDGDEEAVISFTIPGNATGAKIAYSAQQPSTPDTPYGTILTDVESPYTLSGLTNDTAYYVTVYSTNAKDRDTASETKTVTPAAIYPDAPTDTTVVPGYSSATVSFTLPENATSAKISYSTQNPGIVTGPYGTVISNAVSPYTIAGLSNDTKYYITVFATNTKDRDTAGVLMEVIPRYVTLLGFVINQNESDPDSMITYIEMNTDFTPAHMDYGNDAFDYGSWADMWFIKNLKPCMLYYDGAVAYELDPNDYTKKKDGTPSDVANPDFPGNAMVGIPKVYWKIVDNGDDTANVYICDVKLDDDFHCWSHIDANGDEIEYCYVSIYDCGIISDEPRSLSGINPISRSDTDPEYYMSLSSKIVDLRGTAWNIALFADRTLINLLLFLILKNTDSQSAVGYGNSNTYISPSNAGILKPGTLDNKGLFYGGTNSTGVKIFGVEHLWGNLEIFTLGIILSNKKYKLKMTYGMTDGSSGAGYTDKSLYVNSNMEGVGRSGYISKMHLSEYGFLPNEMTGSDTTYYSDQIWGAVDDDTMFAFYGGSTSYKKNNGISCVFFTKAYVKRDITSSTYLSCKPLAPKPYKLFGFVIDQNESDPDSMITYIEDNANFTPAHMDYENDMFDYGSWTVENGAWFMDVKPCMLNYDGTVAYYLDPNDYTKKLDGTPSDVANPDFPGNAMVGIPKVYWKIVDNGDDTANVYICDVKLDDDFHCWSHIDANGDEIEYCYVAAYDGSVVEDKVRSISGKAPLDVGMGVLSPYMGKVRNNNANADTHIWEAFLYSDYMLLWILALLIGRSADTQKTFGNGNVDSDSSLNAGTMDEKGLFYGSEQDGHGVKIFGAENLWGNDLKLVLGLISDKGKVLLKLTYGMQDGSTVEGYNLSGDGYVDIGITLDRYEDFAWIRSMRFGRDFILPKHTGGSSTTYFTDTLISSYIYSKVLFQTPGRFGGTLKKSQGISSFYLSYNESRFPGNVSISCKPLSQTQTGGDNT